MKILFVSQYFIPEMGAPALRTYELAKAWVALGHDVTVLTAFPHHPTGVIPDAYRGRMMCREEMDGIRLLRTYVYAVPNQGVVKRTLSYMSFMVSAVLGSFFLQSKVEVVVATSPQFFVAIAGYVISRLKRLPFVFEIRDLWPESIVAVGAVKNRFAIRLLEGIAHFLYRKADKIVVVADSTRAFLVKWGIDDQKIEMIPNGVDISRFSKPAHVDYLREKYKLMGKFVVSYVGTHGMAHALQSVLDVASVLQHQKDIHFLFVGEGAEKQTLMAHRDTLDLSNVTFVDQQEMERIPSFFHLSDVSLVSLRDVALFGSVLPSKMFEIMAAGCPVVMSLPRGEATALLDRAKAGLHVAAENREKLRDAILKLYEDGDLRRRLGQNGRTYILAHHNRENLARRYLGCLSSLTSKET